MALPGGNSDLTNFKCTLNNTDILICCIQNDLIGETAKDEDKWESTGRPDVQSFLARMVLNDCKKGIIITNSTFSSNAIEFANNLNDQNRGIEIKLIDGYELTKSIRNHKYYIIKEGLINEVKNLLKMGYTKDMISMQGIGYKEIIKYLDGEYTLDEAIDIIKRDSRRYAKRQLTWFRRYDDAKWFNLDEYSDSQVLKNDIIMHIEKML